MVNLQENKAFLIGIGAAVLLTAGLLFLTYRSYETAEEGKQEAQNIRRKIAEARTKKGKIPALEKDVIILRSNVEEYVKILPEKKHLHDFINTINRFEQEAGIVMTKLDAPGKKKKKTKDTFEKIVYKIKIAGSLLNILRFINKFEQYDRFVAISNFTFRPDRGRGELGGDDGVSLGGSLTLETYVYNVSGAGKKPVDIDRIDDKREALEEQIIAQRNAIEVHRYRLDPVQVEARRDIFADPRRRAQVDEPEAPGAERFQKQKRFVAWAKNELKEVQEMIGAEENEPLIIRQMELKKQIDERVSNLNSQLVSARTDRQITAAPLIQELEQDVIDPLARIMKNRRISGRTGLSAADLKLILSKMEHFFKKGDLVQVVAQYDLVHKQIGASNTEDPATKELVVQIYNLKNQAMVISEFSRRSIKISGIVSLKGNPVAIINGKVFQTGQMLDEDVKIHDIRPEEIEFIFRDVRIIRRWE